MATSFMQMAYNLTDMFWMGRLSSASVAAVGTAAMYLWLSMAFVMIGRMGAEIGVSQYMGKGDGEGAARFSNNAFWVAVCLGIVYTAIMIAARGPLIAFFNIEDTQVVREAERYLAVSALALPLIFVHNIFTGVFNGFGNTKLPFYINSIGLIVNILLSPVLIFSFPVEIGGISFTFGAGLGITGAALGTVFASAVNLALKLWAMKKYRNRPFETYRYIVRPCMDTIRQIFKWGIPIAVESMLFTFLFMVMARLIADFGTGAIAAHRVGYQVEALAYLVGGGFASAITAYMGQNFGASRWDRIKTGYRLGVAAMGIYGVLMAAFLFLLAEPLVAIFLSCPEEIRIGGDYLRVISFTQILGCMEGVAAGAFRGQGQTVKPSIVSITGNILRVILTYALVRFWGLNGIWYGIAIAVTIRGAWLMGWYYFYMRKRGDVHD
ncbi:MAG: MATE family efflux transporter [Defluviitaleaceae bacterium]|nr:MATE family efflux transporter [Defluviitaleaceae bacterium]